MLIEVWIRATEAQEGQEREKRLEEYMAVVPLLYVSYGGLFVQVKLLLLMLTCSLFYKL